jgi:hypothetical protein
MSLRAGCARNAVARAGAALAVVRLPRDYGANEKTSKFDTW